MKINKKIWLPIALSIILFVLFPQNFSFVYYHLWIFYLIYLVAYIILFLIPIILVYKKKLSYKYYIGIVLIWSTIFLILWYYWDRYSYIKHIEETKKTFEKVEHLQKLMNERDINKLEDKFKNIKASSNQDITFYQEDIEKWIDEFVNNIWMINLEVYVTDDWSIKKKISIEGDRTNLDYSFYIKWDKLEWVRKNRFDFNPPKWADNSKIDSEKQEDCYTSTFMCSKDMIYLFDFIQKTNIKQ